jgi:geranylgeranyl pyrophosphate synthase
MTELEEGPSEPAVRPEPSPLAEPISAASLLRERLWSKSALAGLSPEAAGLPEALWHESLLRPVLEILGRPGKEFRSRLTRLAFLLAGGAGAPPPALGAIFELIHAGSMIIDDIEDDSAERRGAPAVHRLHGLPLALNAGSWMYFAPFRLLPELELPAEVELRLAGRLGQVLLDCHSGQALDLGARLSAIPQHQLAAVAGTISTLKTGRLLSLAAEVGALCAGADQAVAAALAELGEALGVGLQMLDDLANLSGRAPASKRYEDLRHGRVTWPWAWAAGQLDEAAFANLLQQSEQLSAQARLSIARAPGSDRPGVPKQVRPLGVDFEPLAATLRGLVAGPGRLAAHWHLREALRRLRVRLGTAPGGALEQLEQEIARLEVSYG